MNRKDYQKPTMMVVELRHTGMLMSSEQETRRGAQVSVQYEEEDI